MGGGITCILVIVVMRIVLKEKKIMVEKSIVIVERENKVISVYKDKPYWLFLMTIFLMPLFYKEVHCRSSDWFIDVGKRIFDLFVRKAFNS